MKEGDRYDKDVEQVKSLRIRQGSLQLLHGSIPSMHPHGVFMVILGGILITNDIFSNTLGKLKKLRTRLK